MQKTKKFTNNRLHILLTQTMPADITDGTLVDFGKLAERCGCATASLYRMMHTLRISPRICSKLVEISEGKLQHEALIPFVFG